MAMVNRTLTLTGHHICNCNINTKNYTLLAKLIVQGVDIAFADIDTISIFVTQSPTISAISISISISFRETLSGLLIY